MSVPGEPLLQAEVELERDGFRLRVSLAVEPGVSVVFGPSGAGKSTLLQTIAGLVTPEAGQVVLSGETLFRRGRPGPDADLPARRRRIGYVFQSYALFPHLSARANVAFPLRGRADRHLLADRLLARLSLRGLEDRFPHELSGGQQQRVAIARALASEPRMLLLDEPFAALDLETRRSVRAEVRQVLEALGIPVLLVTHDREEALAMGERIVVLAEGEIVADGLPVQVLGRPSRERVARLAGIENVLRLDVMEVLPGEGIVRCGLGNFHLDVPLCDVRPGERIGVGVRADDVLLASVEPVGLSARNVLPGKVVSLDVEGPLQAVVVDCGQRLVSHVTGGRVADLGLAPGRPVWAVLKSASCLVLRDD